MVKNKNKRIKKNVILLPYMKHHVQKYREWIKSPELQLLTASEPLSLNKEYEMQNSLLIGEDKYTFIILYKSVFENRGDEIGAMIGVTDPFFFHSEDCVQLAESEIMIVEERAKR